MKIALILPRAGLYRFRTGAFPRFLRYAPLTLPTLAALVPEELRAKIELYDEGVEVVNPESIDADLIGLTSITGASQRAYRFADFFRRRGKTVVIGGVHATLLPEEAKEHADSVVIGPAYETWPQLLRDFAAGSLQPFYRASEKIDFTKVPQNAARNRLHSPQEFITVNSVQAVFGCPNICEFCVTPVVCSGYQHRPISDVLAEVSGLAGKYFAFVDPSPIEDTAYATELYRALKPLRKTWTGLATTRLGAHPELMDAMADGGCKGLLIGFESLSQQSNNKTCKAFNRVADYYRLVRDLHDRGIAIMGCFVHGLEEDQSDCFARTLEFVERANIDLPRFTICTPFPGTKFFSRLSEEQRILTRDWALYDGQHVVFQPRRMSIEELTAGHAGIWRDSYRISSIAKRLACSRCFMPIIVLLNIGYRKYGYAVSRYDEQRMANDVLL